MYIVERQPGTCKIVHISLILPLHTAIIISHDANGYKQHACFFLLKQCCLWQSGKVSSPHLNQHPTLFTAFFQFDIANIGSLVSILIFIQIANHSLITTHSFPHF